MRIETIVPSSDWAPRYGPKDRRLREASDSVVARRVPSNAERKAADASVNSLFASGIVNVLLRHAPLDWRLSEYLIYPDKFHANTWRALQAQGFARWSKEHSDYAVPPAIGLLMMSVLADVCAGTQI